MKKILLAPFAILLLASCAPAATPTPLPPASTLTPPSNSAILTVTAPKTPIIGFLPASDRDALLSEVWAYTRDHYYDPTFRGQNWEAMRAEFTPRVAAAATPEAFYALIKEMLGRIGESDAFLTPQEVLYNNTTSPSGAGYRSIPQPEGGVIVRIVQNGPADKAGLKRRDLIQAINGIDFNDSRAFPLGSSSRVDAIRANPSVRLTVQSPNSQPRTVEIVRQSVSTDDPYVNETQVLSGTNTGYIDLISFEQPRLMRELQQLGQGGKLDGLIIDLRSFAQGGNINNTKLALSYFIDGGSAGTLVGRNVSTDIVIPKGGTLPEYNNVPIVVLIGNTTSGGAPQVFAAAMQILKRARIVGTPSFGHTSFGTARNLSFGTQLFLTESIYKLPNGNDIQEVGVQPDRTLDAKWYLFAFQDDPQIKAALEELKKK